jgi:cardiolipin synthase A/B
MLAELSLALSVGWAAYLVVLSAWIILQKRSSASTLAWILGLSLLPVVGFALYHWFGPMRIKRQAVRRRRNRQRVGSVDEWTEHATLAALAQQPSAARAIKLIQRITSQPISTAQRIDMLSDGATTFDALLRAIAEAQQHVHLEYYIVEPDHTGTRIRDALIKVATRGVRVRLLADAVGSARLNWRFLKPLRDAGGEVVFFHPFRLATLKPLLNLRTHRKIVVIDGRVGFAGGVNLTDQQDERQRPDAFRDLHLRIEGEAVHGLQAVFIEDWMYATRRPLIQHGLFPTLPPGELAAQWLPSGPDNRWEPIHRVMMQAINDARQRLWLVTPYFVPTDAARFALTSAALRGVDVRLLVPRRADTLLVTLASRSFFDELLRAGVRVFEYLPRMLHTKAMLVDDQLSILGSANFDERSFRLNFELCVCLHGQAPASTLRQIIETDLTHSREVLRPRVLPLWRRLAEATARLFAPLL